MNLAERRKRIEQYGLTEAFQMWVQPTWKRENKLISNRSRKPITRPPLNESSKRSISNYYHPNPFTINNATRVIANSLKPNVNYKNHRYLYRGVKLFPGNVKNVTGFSSWTHSLPVARMFAGVNKWKVTQNNPWNAGTPGTILRINTNKLKGVPVKYIPSMEHEYVLPPMKIVTNKNSFNKNANRILPVTHFYINERWNPPPNRSMKLVQNA